MNGKKSVDPNHTVLMMEVVGFIGVENGVQNVDRCDRSDFNDLLLEENMD